MNRKIKEIREYRDDYRGSKKQIKRHMCRASRTDREHLKKKDRFDERECADKLYQRHFNKKMTSARHR